MKNPKILLLGAGGFIGANLTERLLQDGKYEVTAIDIESEKLEDRLDHAKLNFKQHDIRSRCDSSSLCWASSWPSRSPSSASMSRIDRSIRSGPAM